MRTKNIYRLDKNIYHDERGGHRNKYESWSAGEQIKNKSNKCLIDDYVLKNIESDIFHK